MRECDRKHYVDSGIPAAYAYQVPNVQRLHMTCLWRACCLALAISLKRH